MSSSSTFEPSKLNDIGQYSIDKLTQLEENLSREFKQLSNQYLTARLSRINTLIDKLNNSIKLTNTNDKNWLKIFNFEIETINNIKTNCEDLVLMNNGVIPNKNDILKSVDEYEEELKEIFNNLQSPLDFDDTITKPDVKQSCSDKLPFPLLFNQVFKPHRQYLKTVINEKDYQTKLIGNLSKGNSVVIWKQYYTRMIKRKQELIQSTLDELNRLYLEYHHLNSELVVNTQNKYYYRSVISPQELNKTFDNGNAWDLESLLKYNHDSNYVNLDSRLLPKNKIELTSIRRNINQKNKHIYKLENTRNTLKRRLDKDELSYKRLKPCDGLDIDDIERDLILLKQNILMKGSNVNNQPIEDTEESEDEEEIEEYQEVSPEEIELRNKYKQLLNSPTNEAPLIIQELPPLERFPRLK